MDRPSGAIHASRKPVCVLIAFDMDEALKAKIETQPIPVEVVACANLKQLTSEQLARAEVVICGDFNAEQFVQSPNLRWIHKMSTGVDRMLYPELLASSVVLTNSAGAHAIPIAEHVIGAMLAIVKEFPKAFRRQQQHSWVKEHTGELYGKTLGIVGMGHVAEEIARLAKAMSMKTIATRRRPIPTNAVDELLPQDRLDEMLGRSDFVVITLPLTPGTRGMFGPAEFRAMKPAAYLINIARGQIVREASMVVALQTGQIAGAALDVASVEPLPADSPLWSMGNVIITPHTSGHSYRVSERAVDLFCDNLVRFWNGEELVNRVDKEAGY